LCAVGAWDRNYGTHSFLYRRNEGES
jgi:hypothetical protein